MVDPVLRIADLTVAFGPPADPVYALRGVTLEVPPGSIVGIVGESGSGKSTLALALMGLLPRAARVEAGSVALGGRDLVGLPERQLRRLRGAEMAMVFQDPMTALNPTRSIGGLLADAQHRDRALPRSERRARALAMLRKVGVPDPDYQLGRFPHHLSGGMRQRIAIAMALLGRPRLLIADEPTTALDVTLEAQILHLLRELRREIAGSILFISHNLGAVAEICDHVAVFYAGQLVEQAPVRELFRDPRHPYTRALLACDPARFDQAMARLPTIGGETPVVRRGLAGCGFAPRCGEATPLCRAEAPAWRACGTARASRCHLAGATR